MSFLVHSLGSIQAVRKKRKDSSQAVFTQEVSPKVTVVTFGVDCRGRHSQNTRCRGGVTVSEETNEIPAGAPCLRGWT
jgi:hypothetical protein